MRAARIVCASLLIAAASCGPTKETYEVTGVVRSVDSERGRVKIAHGDIPGFMPAMTMDFNVERRSMLQAVEPGSLVRFKLERDAMTLLIVELEVTGRDTSAGESGVATGLAESEPAPDFELIDQDGQNVSLSEFRGKVVLLDFVFTRCPGPCPIMTSTHVTLQRKLPFDVASRSRFVSISLDPDYDTPEVMRSYAIERGANLASWSFLTGEKAEIQSVLEAYKVATKRDDGTIDHVMITFLIDPEGRIAHRYVGLGHPPEAILEDLTKLLQG
jgi:protein SCO1/2